MNINIPFLKPKVADYLKYSKYLERIDQSRIYSNYGPLVKEFEWRLLQEWYGGIGNCLTVCNGTLGLILAISNLKKRSGRYAIMPSFTFAATPLAAIWCGLEPYFVDVDPDTWVPVEEQIQKAISTLGDDIALCLPYATFGNEINFSFYEKMIADGIPVVIDAAPGFGGSLDGIPFAQGFSGAVVFSFHATKAFGIGEGGLVYSGNSQLIESLRCAGNFGFSGAREVVELGLNSKMSEYAAAVGLATLDDFPDKFLKRLEIYDWYLGFIKDFGLFSKGWKCQKISGSIPHQFFPILCPDGGNNIEYAHFSEQFGVQFRTYFSPPCHHQLKFKSYGGGNLEITDCLSRRILSLPLWEDMTIDDVEKIILILNGFKNG